MISTLVDRRRHLCGRVQAVGAISGRRRTSSFRPIWRGPGAGRVPRPCTLHTLKTAYPAHQRPSAASRRPPLPWNGHTAMPPCPPGSMLHSCAEVRERFDPNRPAANHTLPATLSSKAKVLERREPWKTRSDRAASSAARLGPASSSSTLSWKPIRDRRRGAGACAKRPARPKHAR